MIVMSSGTQERLYRIGELARLTGIATRTIRFYEDMGILPHPPRTDAGYRVYQAPDIRRLLFIKRAKEMGLSLEAIRSIIAIRDSGTAPCSHVRAVLDEKLSDVRERLRALNELEEDLVSLRAEADSASAECEDGCYCPILERAPATPRRGNPLS